MKHPEKRHTIELLPPFCSLLIISLLLILPACAEAEVIDRVVAEVNDDIITMSEVDEEGHTLFQKIIREVPAEEREQTLRTVKEQIVDSLIDKRLLAQQAAKQNIVVTEEEIDKAIEQILAANNVSSDDFFENLRQRGIDEATYRSNIKSQIFQNNLVAREVRSKIVITEDMILDYYDTSYTKQVSEGSYYLLQIGISWGETADSEKPSAALSADKTGALEKAERIHRLALEGNDFRELARKFSDLPSAAEGGDLGAFAEDEMASYMRDAVVKLKPGEISPIIETPVGFQFFKLLSSKEGGIVMQAPYESVKEEIRERLFRETLERDYETWLKSIREQAYIRKL